MIDMRTLNTNTLCYVALSPTGDVVASWPWLEAPRYVRQRYRRRPDYFAVAPNRVISRDKRHHVR